MTVPLGIHKGSVRQVTCKQLDQRFPGQIADRPSRLQLQPRCRVTDECGNRFLQVLACGMLVRRHGTIWILDPAAKVLSNTSDSVT